MTRMGLIAMLIACVGLTTWSVSHAQSRLLGDTYTYSAKNFPGDIGVTEDPEEDRPRTPMDSGTLPAILTFDGIEEAAGGMLVNERVVAWPGQPGGIPAVQATGIDGQTEWDLIDWENAGEVVEFSFRTASGEYLSSDEGGQSFITMTDLNWQNSDAGSMPYFFETGFYMYYAKDGVPATGYATQLPEIGLLAGEHPFDKSVEEVFYIAYSRGQVDDITLPSEGGVDLTFGTTQLDENTGSWDLLAEVMGLFELQGTFDELRIGFLVDPPTGTAVTIRGDFNGDGALDASDINALTTESAAGTNNVIYDLNDDTRVDDADVAEWIQADDIFKSWIGDLNLDKEFNTSDLVDMLAAGKYETGAASVWSEGDFDGNGLTDSGDLVAALAGGGYEAGAKPAVAAVPEPGSAALLVLGSLLCLGRRRRAG